MIYPFTKQHYTDRLARTQGDSKADKSHTVRRQERKAQKNPNTPTGRRPGVGV